MLLGNLKYSYPLKVHDDSIMAPVLTAVQDKTAVTEVS